MANNKRITRRKKKEDCCGTSLFSQYENYTPVKKAKGALAHEHGCNCFVRATIYSDVFGVWGPNYIKAFITET